MTGGSAALLALAAALLAWPPARARGRGRVAAPPAPVRSASREAALAAAWQRRLLAAAAGGAVGLLVGGVLGLLAAVVVGALGERALRSGAAADGDRGAALEQELPVACDLLAVCLSAGLPTAAALAAVATAVHEPLSGELRRVAGLTRLGAEPRSAWAGAPEELAALARVLVRAGESGSAVGPALRALAADARVLARTRIEADVRRAGVWVLAPLGLCFLPAFLCLGVVPLVLGIAGEVFG
ncbi:type II secretion system F family protein [Geodermatophilus sp. SYSU D00815]